MKIREGFVSNSSSSSFTCCISGRNISGYDMCMSEAEMVECEKGHMMYEDYMYDYLKKIVKEGIKVVRSLFDEDTVKDFNDIINGRGQDELTDDEIYDAIMQVRNMRCEFPSGFCPVCQLENVIEEYILRYLLKRMGRTKSNLSEEIQERYSYNPEEFFAYIIN